MECRLNVILIIQPVISKVLIQIYKLIEQHEPIALKP